MKVRWILCLVLSSFGLGAAAQAPLDGPWWPSPWGAEDERGASNRITPERVLEAARLIREGKIYSLGRLYEAGMPGFGNRHFSLTIPGVPTGGPFGENRIVYNDELFSGEIGQVGTQFDGLGHIGTRIGGEDVFYNGFVLSEFGDAYGLKRLGVENAGPFFTRGVLLDVAAYKDVERLEGGYVITVEDIEGTLAREGIEIREGDVVLFRTGHGKLWMQDNAAYSASNPGPGVTAIRWLVEKKMGGGDTVRSAMGAVLAPGKVFIDIGANIGLYSILAASGYGAEVYAFEPSERELRRLERNAALNGVAIRTFAVALGDIDGECTLTLAAAGNHTVNRVGAPNANTPNGAACEMRRLDTVLGPDVLRRTALVKIDVEGYEMNVLRGMEGALEHLRAAALVVEVTPEWLICNGGSAEELYAYLTTRGWRPLGYVRQEKQWDEVFVPPVV